MNRKLWSLKYRNIQTKPKISQQTVQSLFIKVVPEMTYVMIVALKCFQTNIIIKYYNIWED